MKAAFQGRSQKVSDRTVSSNVDDLQYRARILLCARNGTLCCCLSLFFLFVIGTYQVYTFEKANAMLSDDRNFERYHYSKQHMLQLQQQQQMSHLKQGHLMQQQLLLRSQEVPDHLKADYMKLHSDHLEKTQSHQLEELQRLHDLHSEHSDHYSPSN